ncbi:hypothetical protein Gotur_024644, partial [Gossypium turneri]
MVMASELQPSLEYIQWYYSCGKPFILGGQSTIVPPHMQQLGGSYPAGSDYIPSFSGGEYAYEFELFGSYPPQYGMRGPSGPYSQHHGLLPVQVRRCRTSHRIFPLCLPHPHLRQMMMLVVANTQNVTVD